MSTSDKKAAEKTAATKARFLVLGVSRRDVLFLLSTEDGEEADKVARDGVMQSKFADTFVLPIEAHYSEAGIRWANPDGVRHEPAQGAPLNPNEGEQSLEQEPRASEKQPEAEEVSKRDNIEAEAREQIESGASTDTGEPDKRNHEAKGNDTTKTSAFDGAASSSGGAKSGIQSSSDVKGTSTASDKK